MTEDLVYTFSAISEVQAALTNANKAEKMEHQGRNAWIDIEQSGWGHVNLQSLRQIFHRKLRIALTTFESQIHLVGNLQNLSTL